MRYGYLNKVLLFFITFMFIFPFFTFAEMKAGEVKKFVGNVTLYKGNDFRGKRITDNNTPVFPNDSLKTLTESRAFVKLSDKSEIIMNELSTLNVTGFKNTDVEDGEVLFNITKTSQLKGFMVKTKTATIGVKGTQFAVVADNRSMKVFLNEGRITVEAVKGEFKRYVEKELDEFEAYLLQQQSEYKKYKENLKKEFVEYARSFTLDEGGAVSIVDNEVKNIEIPEKIKNDFRLFEDF